jgi:hypothetical protein
VVKWHVGLVTDQAYDRPEIAAGYIGLEAVMPYLLDDTLDILFGCGYLLIFLNYKKRGALRLEGSSYLLTTLLSIWNRVCCTSPQANRRA